MLRNCVAMCLLGLTIAAPAVGQRYEASYAPASTKFGLGFGMALTTSLYFPKDLNDFTDDIVDAVGLDVNESPPLLFGLGARACGQLSVGNMVQLELWLEYLYGGKKKLDLYYYEYFSGSYLEEEFDVAFSPSYIAPGITLYLTPGMASGLYPKLGAGIGLYKGRMEMEGRYSYSYYDYDTGSSDYYYERISEEYTGSAIGVHGVIGFAFALTDNFHLEGSVVGRYAKIDELENEDGELLVNDFRDDEKVTLDFSGIDFRLGGSLVF